MESVNLQYEWDKYLAEMGITSSRNVGQAFTWSVMGNEAIQAIQDLRWMIILCIILIIADYRFGMAESKKKHHEALKQHNDTLAKLCEFRLSRAVRRTFNKFVDYMTFLLIFCILGFAITEPYGICNHVITAGIAVIIACICELCSIFGHFLYLQGVEKPKITWKNFFLFFGKILASFAKTKDEDLGTALDEALVQSLQENKDNEKEGV